MCGIAGMLNLRSQAAPIDPQAVAGMLAMIRHRGPDGFGLYCDEWAALGSARLSIIDLSGGDQPIANEDGTLWIVFNGEIFNYVELRAGLVARGHRFATQSDTEVIVHLYEERGPACLELLNGQFALAIWDTRSQSLFLARDRLGVRPLFYSSDHDRLIFGSEIKAILAHPGVSAEIDPAALEQAFVCWSVLAPRTLFKGIAQLPPGHSAMVSGGQIMITQWWSPEIRPDGRARDERAWLDELDAVLLDATRIRLRADVPVGAYLSGGLDSSLTTVMAQRLGYDVDTFSIAFTDAPGFDERAHQAGLAQRLGVRNHVLACSRADVGEAFPRAVWHAETALSRTAPAPMLLLSGLAHQHGLKVVLDGRGRRRVLRRI